MNIKEIRVKALLTQEEFAEEIGVSISAVRKWEIGERCPSLKQQRKLLEFCKKRKIKL